MQLTPANWNIALAPAEDWKKAYGYVAEAVIWHLQGKIELRLTTADLVETLYPEAWARGDGITARKRIFDALRALAKHQLKDWCEPGPPRPLRHRPGKLVTPLIWRLPAPAVEREPTDVEIEAEVDATAKEADDAQLPYDGPNFRTGARITAYRLLKRLRAQAETT